MGMIADQSIECRKRVVAFPASNGRREVVQRKFVEFGSALRGGRRDLLICAFDADYLVSRLAAFVAGDFDSHVLDPSDAHRHADPDQIGVLVGAEAQG